MNCFSNRLNQIRVWYYCLLIKTQIGMQIFLSLFYESSLLLKWFCLIEIDVIARDPMTANRSVRFIHYAYYTLSHRKYNSKWTALKWGGGSNFRNFSTTFFNDVNRCERLSLDRVIPETKNTYYSTPKLLQLGPIQCHMAPDSRDWGTVKGRGSL